MCVYKLYLQMGNGYYLFDIVPTRNAVVCEAKKQLLSLRIHIFNRKIQTNKCTKYIQKINNTQKSQILVGVLQNT